MLRNEFIIKHNQCYVIYELTLRAKKISVQKRRRKKETPTDFLCKYLFFLNFLKNQTA